MSPSFQDYDTQIALRDLKIFYEKINDAVNVGPTCVPQYSVTIDSILSRMDDKMRQHFMQVPNPHFVQPPRDWSVEKCRKFFVIVSESIETGLKSSRCIDGTRTSSVIPWTVGDLGHVHQPRT